MFETITRCTVCGTQVEENETEAHARNCAGGATDLTDLADRARAFLQESEDRESFDTGLALDILREVAYCVTIPKAEAWRETGPDADPKSRLLKSIELEGLAMHLEAYAVDPFSAEQRFMGAYAQDAQDVANALCPDGAWRTIAIPGYQRQYVLIATPMGS